VNKFLTHVESDCDNVEAHCGVCNTTEGWGLSREHTKDWYGSNTYV